MKYLIILTALALSGCGTIESWEIVRANEICKSRGGIHSVTENGLLLNAVICGNGSRHVVKRGK